MQYHQFTKVRNTVGFMIGKNLYNKPCLDIHLSTTKHFLCSCQFEYLKTAVNFVKPPGKQIILLNAFQCNFIAIKFQCNQI